MSFSEYKVAQAGNVYGTFAVPRAALSAAQKEAAARQAKLRRVAYATPAGEAAWRAQTKAARSAAAKARGRPEGSLLATTKGYFEHYADRFGLTVSKQAVTAINKLLAEQRKSMIERAVHHAVDDGVGAVLALHVATAIATPAGLRFAVRKAPKKKAGLI
jgi:hypothetical protein